MKLSELIEKLAGLAAEHGDVYTTTEFICCCYGMLSEDPDPRFDGTVVVL